MCSHVCTHTHKNMYHIDVQHIFVQLDTSLLTLINVNGQVPQVIVFFQDELMLVQYWGILSQSQEYSFHLI